MASNTAQVAKDKGNASFKAGNWADAVGHYSAAIVADRTEPTYALNRAAAYLKLDKHRDAERDCTTVLNLDDKNVKALFRRAQARAALERLAEAEKDLTEALKLEPANAAIKNELAGVQRRKLDAVKKETSSKQREPISIPSLPSSSQPRGNPIPQTEAPRPRRITRNVPIEMVEAAEKAPELESSTDFLRPIQSRVLSPSPSPSVQPSETPTSTSKHQPRVGAAIFRADGKHTILRTPTSDAVPSPVSTLSTSSHTSAQIPAPGATASDSPAVASAFGASIPPPPLTHFAFTRAWYALPAPQERYSLLTRIPPESLPALFQSSLEPELLVSILRAFEAVASPATISHITAYMSVFPSIPRFKTVLLFLSPKERDVVRTVWDRIGANVDSEKRHMWYT